MEIKNFSQRTQRSQRKKNCKQQLCVLCASVRNLFFIFLFFIAGSPVFSQVDTEEQLFENEIEEPAFFVEYDEDTVRFIQRLTWEPAQYAYRYEVVIEQMTQDGYTKIDRMSVNVPSAEVSLSAGLYRYKIDVYDLLNELSFETEWLEFEIKRALQPRIVSFSPSAFYLDEDTSYVITLRGQNIIAESEVFLISNTQGSSLRITPRRMIPEGSSARLEFSAASLARGEYSIYIRNPGGLDETALETFVVTNKKAFDLNFSLGYAPVIPLQGFLFKDYQLEAPFPDGFYPLGASLKADFIPFKLSWGYLGAEASLSYTHLTHEREFYSAQSSVLNIHLSFLYQIYLFERKWALNINLGFGLTSLLGYQYTYPIGPPAESVTAHYASFSAGLSLMYLINKTYFVHAGLDFIQFLSAGENVSLPNFFRPFLAAGIKL